MYARNVSRNLLGQSAEAKLLIEVRIRQVVAMICGPDSFRDVIGLDVQSIVRLNEAAI